MPRCAVGRTNLQQMLGGQTQGGGPCLPSNNCSRTLNRSLAEQLTVYREDSPTIATLRRRIDTVTRNLEAEKRAPARMGLPSSICRCRTSTSD